MATLMYSFKFHDFTYGVLVTVEARSYKTAFVQLASLVDAELARNWALEEVSPVKEKVNA